jgi:predicted transposase/invertase (TIGR01784 family)
MANELLMSISQDEREQALYRSRRIFERDMEHNFAVARKEGRAEGRIDLIKSMLANGISASDISKMTGLPITEIEGL